MPDKDTKFLRANDARVEQHSKSMGNKIKRWLDKYAREMAERAISQLGKKGRMKLTKIDDDTLSRELLEILIEAGFRQVKQTGKTVAQSLGAEFSLQQQLIDQIIRDKEIKVTNIMRESRAAVQNSIKQILADSAKERPKPTVGALARRISISISFTEHFERERLKDKKKTIPSFAFSAERAALIARTESAQIENTATVEGMRQAGIEEIEWLARRDGKSGDRHHERMNGKRVKIGEEFVTPLGNKMRYPGDPRAPIKETANCRCTVVPVRRRVRK